MSSLLFHALFVYHLDIEKNFPQVKAVQGDIEQPMPFASGYFDKAIAIHVLEHLHNLPAAIEESCRVLAPKGIFTLVLPCEGGFSYGLARRISAQRLFEKTYKQSYDWFIQREHVNTF